MAVLLLDHLPGCSPVYKCASCVIAAHLQKILKAERFDELVTRLAALAKREIAFPALNIQEIELLPEFRVALKELAGIHLPIEEVLRGVLAAPLHTLLSELEMPVRTQSKLFQVGVRSIGDAKAKGKHDLLAIKGVGQKMVEHLEAALILVGHELPD